MTIQAVCSGSDARIRLVATGGDTVRARGTVFAGTLSDVLIGESTTWIDFASGTPTSARVTVASSDDEPFLIDVTSQNVGTTCTFLGSVTPIDGDL